MRRAARTAPSRTGPRAARVATTLIFFLSGSGFAHWVVRIPAVQAHLNLDERALGLALFGVAVGALAMLGIMPAVMARWGGRKVLRSASVLFAGSLALPALAPTGLTLFFALAVFGAATAALDVAMNAQAGAIEARLAKPVMSSFHAAFSFGALMGAALGGLAVAVHWTPAQHLLTVAAVSGLLGAVAGRFLLSEDTKVATGAAGIPAPARGRIPARVLLLGGLAFCAVFTEGAVNDWSAVYLQQLDASSGGRVALGFAGFSLAMTAGRLLGDPLTARFGPVRLLRGGAGLATLGFLICASASSVLAASVGFVLVGAGTAAMFPLIVSAASRSGGMTPAAAITFVSLFGYGGFLVGPPLIGLVSDYLDLRVGLGLAAVVTASVAAGASVVDVRAPEQLPGHGALS